MAAPLSVLVDRVKAYRARMGRPAKARIAIRRADASPGSGRITGVVVVDRRQRGDMVDDRPAFVHVEPGVHRLTVHFGWPRAMVSGKHQLSIRIKVGPGEVVELVCGTKDGWRGRRVAARRSVVLLAAITYVVPAIAWFSRRAIGETLVGAMIFCHVPTGLVNWAGTALQSPGGFLLVLFACVWIPCVVALSVRNFRRGKRVNSEVGEPYFLEELPGGLSD
ncbi:MAG: hypothetical protein ACYC61_28770 [Isosphaeraceae bacterium]